jgi:hypothetical protein
MCQHGDHNSNLALLYPHCSPHACPAVHGTPLWAPVAHKTATTMLVEGNCYGGGNFELGMQGMGVDGNSLLLCATNYHLVRMKQERRHSRLVCSL